MSRHLSSTLAAVVVALLAGSTAQAAVCIGACGTLGADGDVTAPPGGSSYGWVSTAGGVTGKGQIDSVGGTNGSAFITSSFAANAGDNLHYDFNFVSSDGQSGEGSFIYEDYAFVQLVDAFSGDLIAMLFNARTEPAGLISPGLGLPPVDPGVTLTPPTSPLTLGSGANGGPVWSPLGSYSGACWGPGCGLTGWISADYTVAEDGDYRLVFGVSNWGDEIYDTGLAFTGIKVGGSDIGDHEDPGDDDDGPGAVPEPDAWALMVLGFGGLGAMLRSGRRRRLA
ncbi:MAG: NF038132 family protein [Phenylobacterium sp.]|uniref:NF038132 family protein n=1 Tax=Phenylobacterium sp. TaxID=1871053 RepID=UPI001A4DE2B7|nr:NF038132 family protein [Phenylobacterium sp.]MBL8769834.1 NF038132 family protein [Phenylobacterium sp.]